MTGDEVRIPRVSPLKRVMGRGSSTRGTLRLLARAAQQLKLLPKWTRLSHFLQPRADQNPILMSLEQTDEKIMK